MTDLTEQWKKGELPEGFYYAKSRWSDEIEIRYIHNGVDYWEKIFADVPLYREWDATNSYIKSLEEKIKIYERKEKQHTNDSIAYNQLVEENAQLKELLKECFGLIYEHGWRFEQDVEKAKNLIVKLNEVLR